MAWGEQGANVAPWVARLVAHDPSFRSLVILSFRKLTDEAVEALCDALAGNTVLTELGASGHALSDRAVAAFGRMLAANSSLRSLALGNTTLGVDGLHALLTAGLERNAGLQDLNLVLKGLEGAPAGAALARVAMVLPTLRSLHACRNPLGDAGVAALSTGLRPGLQLTALHLADCELTSAAVPAVVCVLEAMPSLHTLVLSRNTLGAPLRPELVTPGQAMAGFAAVVAAHRALATLELDECLLSGSDVGLLASALVSTRDCQLRFLSLAGNKTVGDEAVQALLGGWLHAPASGASTEDTGCTLNVTQCGLSCESLKAAELATRVSTLRLFGNGFGLAGLTLQHLALLGCLPVLKDLDLGGNDLSEGFIANILESLIADAGFLPQLTTLGLGGNKLDKVQVEAMHDTLLPALHERRPNFNVII